MHGVLLSLSYLGKACRKQNSICPSPVNKKFPKIWEDIKFLDGPHLQHRNKTKVETASSEWRYLVPSNQNQMFCQWKWYLKQEWVLAYWK